MRRDVSVQTSIPAVIRLPGFAEEHCGVQGCENLAASGALLAKTREMLLNRGVFTKYGEEACSPEHFHSFSVPLVLSMAPLLLLSLGS